ncbi:hypothetical protein MLD38_033130 [Melastoma candidum]|uniref:Uncharacterized protein n=1 Tax=Melastoma candidum TaxID=119954 RepID=A0ACB9M5I6_9MYRT|nr:hypothetical protein MLD38_033130 [Melastoma candidum]
MELENRDRNAGRFATRIKSSVMETGYGIVRLGKSLRMLGEEDPRRIIHSFKFGLALTLVSLLYYVRPLWDEFGVSGMWAIITVIVDFDFSVGGTLSRFTYRGCATFAGAALGAVTLRLTCIFHEVAQAIIIGALVFLLAAAAAFLRFVPVIKERYDYGVKIFILTVSVVLVYGYRYDDSLEWNRERFQTILIGWAICVMVSICLWPTWAGKDLQNMIAMHMEKLAIHLEEFGRRYFASEERPTSSNLTDDDKTSEHGYQCILVSKTTEEDLANFTKWEMFFGLFRSRYSWEHYLKIGDLARKCACQIEALGCHVNSNIQASTVFDQRIKELCIKISSELSMALNVFSQSIKSMTDPSPANVHVRNSSIAAKELESAVKEMLLDGSTDILTMVPSAATTVILAQVVNCVENISEAVHELAQVAAFKGIIVKSSLLQRFNSSRVVPVTNSEECIIAIPVVQENDFILTGA